METLLRTLQASETHILLNSRNYSSFIVDTRRTRKLAKVQHSRQHVDHAPEVCSAAGAVPGRHRDVRCGRCSRASGRL